MFGTLARMLSQLLVAGCCLSLNVLVVSVAVLVRHLPGLLLFARKGLRWWLVISYRAYHALLSRLAGRARAWLQVDLLATLPRILVSTLLSLGWGVGLLALLGVPLRVWSIGPFALHGLLVGWLWDEVAEPGGIRLGERL